MSGEHAQGFFIAYPLGCLECRGENAPNTVRARGVGNRAVADCDTRVLRHAVALDPPKMVLGKKAVALAVQDAQMQRPQLTIDFGPDLAQRPPQHARMPVTE